MLEIFMKLWTYIYDTWHQWTASRQPEYIPLVDLRDPMSVLVEEAKTVPLPLLEEQEEVW